MLSYQRTIVLIQIHAQTDIFTTDTFQSPWPPSSSLSQPAPSAQQQHIYQPPPQQDFVLFDDNRSQPARTTVNLPASSSASSAAAFGDFNSSTPASNNPDLSTSPALQNQRVQQIIQANGHQFPPSASPNRFNSFAQTTRPSTLHPPPSAPSSTAAVNPRNRLARPPVPLFSQGQQRPAANMDLQDAMQNLEGFTAFAGGSTAYSSPALGHCDLTNVSPSPSSANLGGTVSPSELLIQEPFSAPNSAAFTNLTTPSNFGESPGFEQWGFSPSFSDMDAASGSEWPSLFPDARPAEQSAAVQNVSPGESLDGLDALMESAASRRKADSSPSLSSRHGRHSSVSGVSSRRRDKPLPPIIVDDPNDTVAMKRARNTLAARKSRERKAQKMEEYEEKIAKLEAERDYWKRIATNLSNGA
ncbi:hypothetical protein F5Y17DRAFT_458170 [Xylariaceae sp. FL0594]|nr:hypothetical protein F5Y17DRAFT_458170 [Xylariaceae sp. FL0594]